MNRFRCAKCGPAGDHDWESPQARSFCLDCGTEGERMREFGCGEHDPPTHAWAPSDEAPLCPDCGGAMYRVIYAPPVITQARREAGAFADATVERELTRQGAGLTSLHREAPAAAPEFAARWTAPSAALAQGRAIQYSESPFHVERPATRIEGRHDAHSSGH